MASAFKFAFHSDDIEEDVSESERAGQSGHEPEKPDTQVQTGDTKERGGHFKAKIHTLDEFLDTLPSQISYNTLKFKLFTEKEEYISVPRREVFDATTQYMAELDLGESSKLDLARELETFDVKLNLYEGGSKTWESSRDLAAVLAADYSFLMEEEEVEEVRVVELGSGPAIPSLALLRSLFLRPRPTEPAKRKLRFVLSDYNSPFLHLITVPNILLTWYVCRHPDAEPVSEVDIDSQLVNEFRSDLAAYGLSFTFISGRWSAEWADFAFPPAKKGSGELIAPGEENEVGRGYTLIFTSETIYNPTTVPSIVDVLVSILDRAAEHHHNSALYPNPKALVAAKKLYFGVGGGVDFFHAVLKERAGERIKVVEKADVTDEGVGRVVWEVELTGRRA